MYILAPFFKDKVSIGVWIYLWAFYFVPLIYVSVFVPVPYCLDDCGIVVEASRGVPGETGIHLEWKQRTPLCCRIATGISWSSLGGLKGVKPPEAFGERSRDWSLGTECTETSLLQQEFKPVRSGTSSVGDGSQGQNEY